MFSSLFREAQETSYLQIISVDFEPSVLEIVLTFLYTEIADIPLDLALDTIYAADMLCLEKLKTKAAAALNTLGNDSVPINKSRDSQKEMKAGNKSAIHNNGSSSSDGPTIDIYDVIRTGWELRLPRLEHFSARYFANRLEDFIDEESFLELVVESSERIKDRQKTDTIELIDE